MQNTIEQDVVQLLELSRKLTSLLENPEYFLATWRNSVVAVVNQINLIMTQKPVEKKELLH